MRLELLNMPMRRRSILPEIVEFFRSQGIENWERHAQAFIERFAEMAFSMPTHDEIRQIHRDQAIVEMLLADDSIAQRLKILIDYKLPWHYIENVYRLCEGHEIAPPPSVSRRDAIEQAAALIDRYPALAYDISSIYGLRPKERAQIPMVRKAIATSTQQRYLRVLALLGGAGSPDDLRGRTDAPISPQTAAQMAKAGLVRRDNGVLELTSRGRAASV